jgi:hypothetical protein
VRKQAMKPIKLNLTDQLATDLRKLFELLAFDKKYWEIPWENYSALEYIVKCVNEVDTQLSVQVKPKDELDFEYLKEVLCETCGHTGFDHCGTGKGLCSSCECECWEFVKQNN